MFLPSFSANGMYARTNKQISLLEEDMFIPVIPYSAIDPETGVFNPMLDPANTFVMNPNGGFYLDQNGNPVFQRYAWLPKEKLKIGSKNTFAGGISMIQPIYTGGKIRELNRISQYGEKIAQSSKKIEESEVLYSVEEAYWRTVSLQEKVKMVETYLLMIDRLSTDLENLYNEGIIIRNDILKVKVKSNELNLNLLKAKNGLTLSRMALCQLTGKPLSSEIILVDSLASSVKLIPEMAYADSALMKRAELDVLGQTLNITRSSVNVMKSRYLPNIGLTASYMLMNPNPYKGFAEEFGGDWNVGLAINIPIFHWNDKAHTLRAAKHEQKVAELRLNEAREMISLQVQQSIFTANETVKKVAMAEENLRLALENLRVAEDSFAEGVIKTTDLLEAQAMWQDAWSELIDARMENQLSVVNLKKVTGND
jgi:outer membrane protein TolC